MTSDMIKLLCVMAITLCVSSCGSRNDPSSSEDDAVTTVNTDDILTITSTTGSAEVIDGTETSDGIATAVPAVSSAQMDAFIDNPLLKSIPGELNGGTSTSLATSYIVNPLMN